MHQGTSWGGVQFLSGITLLVTYFFFRGWPSFDNTVMFKVQEWKGEEAFHSCEGHPTNYAREIFLLTVTPPHIAEWRGLESYKGEPNTFALLLNLKNQLEFLLYEIFAEFCIQDWKAIQEEADCILS